MDCKETHEDIIDVAKENEFDIEFDLDELDIEYLTTIKSLEQAVEKILNFKCNAVE